MLKLGSLILRFIFLVCLKYVYFLKTQIKKKKENSLALKKKKVSCVLCPMPSPLLVVSVWAFVLHPLSEYVIKSVIRSGGP